MLALERDDWPGSDRANSACRICYMKPGTATCRCRYTVAKRSSPTALEAARPWPSQKIPTHRAESIRRYCAVPLRDAQHRTYHELGPLRMLALRRTRHHPFLRIDCWLLCVTDPLLSRYMTAETCIWELPTRRCYSYCLPTSRAKYRRTPTCAAPDTICMRKSTGHPP